VIFTPTALAGAYIIDPQPLQDHRGFFARTWCRKEYEAHGLDARIAQCSISYNARKGTLRGMHFQKPPQEEIKVVCCTRGALYDVIIDLRAESPSFAQHLAVELTQHNRRMLYIPAGFAHGFQTLEDDTEVSYQMSEFYRPESACGVRWNDPAFNIAWPIRPPIILERDASYPDFHA
jgi:dTDP-4-dehydrorhamnose 3,5-epimerase